MVVESAELQEKFRRGREAHRNGDLHAARVIYEELLAVHPEHIDALHALADLSTVEGQLERAVALLGRALHLAPKGRGLQASLGNALLLLGQRAEALAAHRKELDVSPDSPMAHNQIGALLLADDRVDDAIPHLEKATLLAPGFALAANNLGRALFRARRFADAEKALRAATRLEPQSADTRAHLGHALLAQQRFDDAGASFDLALAREPDHRDAHLGLGLLARATGRSKLALSHFEKVLSVAPDDVTALRESGDILYTDGLLQQALERFTLALEIEPFDPDLLTQAATASRVAGDDDAALEFYRRALAQKSSHQSALSGFALLMAERGEARVAAARLAPTVNSGRGGPQLLATYARLLGELDRRREGIALLEGALQKTLPDDIARQLHFTLAQLLDRDKSYDLAFYHCRRANAMVRTSFDADAFHARIDRTIESFDLAGIEAVPEARPQPAVFVVGMPRSGLNVLRSVLSAHPQLRMNGPSRRLESGVLALWESAGARWPELPSRWPGGVFDDASIRVSGSRRPDPQGRAFVDTSWRNFLYLGVIARLFPQAHIIECVRDARDVALSCFFLQFAKGNELPFSYDLADIAAYYNGYRKLMAHWRRVLRLPMLSVTYEELALDSNATCESIADFLKVEWRREYFALAEQTSVTGQPDVWRPVARSVRRHRHYKQHLESFVELLDDLPEEHG